MHRLQNNRSERWAIIDLSSRSCSLTTILAYVCKQALRHAWAEDQADHLLEQQTRAKQDQDFYRNWIGMGKNPHLTDGNMYIWRNEGEGDAENVGGDVDNCENFVQVGYMEHGLQSSSRL